MNAKLKELAAKIEEDSDVIDLRQHMDRIMQMLEESNQ
jgi:hypothetical protein